MRKFSSRYTWSAARIAFLGALATIAAIGMTVSGPAALAQQAQTAGPVSLGDLFTPDSSVLTPDGEQKVLQAAAQLLRTRAPDCPLQARFKVVVKQGDPMYQEALARARRDVIQQLLNRPDMPTSPYEFETEVGGRVDDVRVDYETRPDKEPPKLDTNSTPRKGTKVKAGDQIKVTMIARDDVNRWQTGIRTIQLIAEGEPNDFVGAQHYMQVLPRCAALPLAGCGNSWADA
jgi:hypothetical protein